MSWETRQKARVHRFDLDTDRCACGCIMVWAWGREMCEWLADDVQDTSDPRLHQFKKPRRRDVNLPLYD